MTNLKLSWLGTPTIERDSLVLHLETRKSTALLAFLSYSLEPHPRETLAALFWPEFSQTRALANLRRTLASVTQALGPGYLATDREKIGIDPNASIWQDVGEYRSLLADVKAHGHAEIASCPECLGKLERVVSLHRGDFLEGMNLRDCPGFDDWQYLQRESLRSELASALERLAHAYLAEGAWDKAIPRARQWVNLDRLNESAQRMLIQSYALAGQRNAALRQLDECTRWLQDDLGQSPEQETITLMHRIQTGEFGKHAGHSRSDVTEPIARVYKEPLFKLKLFVPPLRAGLVSRPHLIAKLEQGAHCALTLISAPAGYGKTTLLSEWIDTLRTGRASVPWTVCWLSLDEGDNDPIRFQTYLTAALEYGRLELSAETRSLLQSVQSPHPTTPLSMIINDLQESPQSVILVLDDYQVISSPTIHDGVTFLLEHMPINVHLVIATRSDPPLRIARLRARGQLNELRARDLRFTSGEAAAFLNRVSDLALSTQQLTTLEIRTEGWIAGLQMAAISMHGRMDVAQFIDVFSGSSRYIMDYLTEEALCRQSTVTQAFLLRTSILERLSESLCSLVLCGESNGETDQLPSPKDLPLAQGECQNIIAELERSNLFIVPLDDDRTWYRYHHLFADLLRTRLEKSSPELIPILHARASVWFEQNGSIEESIAHSLAAHDWDNVGRLIDLHFHKYLENGQMATVLKWIEGLPHDTIFKSAKLCAQVAEVYAQAGMLDHIDAFLDRAEEILTSARIHVAEVDIAQSRALSRSDENVILSMVGILRGLKAVCSGDPDRAVVLTQGALTDVPEMEPRELAVLFWVEGWAQRSLGNLDRALDSFSKAREYALKSGAILRDVWTDLANATRLVGKLPQAIDIFTNSLQAATDRGVQNQGNLSRDETFLSLILLEQNQLDLALAHATRAVAYTQWWPSHIIVAMAYASIAEILLARDDLDGSLRAIERADQERRGRLVTPFVHSMVDVTRVRISLVRREWVWLDQWSSDLISKLQPALEEGRLIDEYLEMQLIMLVRVWLEKTKIDRNHDRVRDCLGLLARLEDSSQAAGRFNSLVEILVLKESIRYSQGETSEALMGIDRCLSMAEPGGYVRIFLNTGEPARVLLSAYLQRVNPTHKAYALKIIEELGGMAGTGVLQDKTSESITCREMEVLHLLAEGLSNRQIAERLVLAEGTVKFHVHSLLGKLQVESRTQAIARARDLELI